VRAVWLAENRHIRPIRWSNTHQKGETNKKHPNLTGAIGTLSSSRSMSEKSRATDFNVHVRPLLLSSGGCRTRSSISPSWVSLNTTHKGGVKHNRRSLFSTIYCSCSHLLHGPQRDGQTRSRRCVRCDRRPACKKAASTARARTRSRAASAHGT
jgi:hypothetical protein